MNYFINGHLSSNNVFGPAEISHARVVLTAILIGFSLGLLFEGFMIGPEYRRDKPLFLILMVLLIEGLFIAILWIRERKKM